ncbi:hypothetical protein [Mesorhizobium sp. L48C026A00]|uniref:hypothetical protein n=1 Tax=Mesorhizobium sp. L48C026A00 TaxID=1287182 RepID=UPI0003CFD800|nr:hypothetical protein [Mesorhizobium sp. L48C026A00]ESY99210.1 hypothetical protein X737_39230 [Mesorhizobium sp. L48C026A00]
MGATLTDDGVLKAFGSAEVLKQIAIDGQAGAFVSRPVRVREINAIADVRRLRGAGPRHCFDWRTSCEPLGSASAQPAMVFQSYDLYPHMTVEENITLPLVMESLSAVQRLPMVGPFVSGGEPR